MVSVASYLAALDSVRAVAPAKARGRVRTEAMRDIPAANSSSKSKESVHRLSDDGYCFRTVVKI